MKLSGTVAVLVSVALVFGNGVIAPRQADAKGCLSGAALGGVAGHYMGHTFLGMFGGCIAGRTVYKMYARWKERNPNGTMHDFVESHRDSLPPGWTERLEALAPHNVPAHR